MGGAAWCLTLGHELRLALYLWYARPAFSMGLSRRPPPATMPTIARQLQAQAGQAEEGEGGRGGRKERGTNAQTM